MKSLLVYNHKNCSMRICCCMCACWKQRYNIYFLNIWTRDCDILQSVDITPLFLFFSSQVASQISVHCCHGSLRLRRCFSQICTKKMSSSSEKHNNNMQSSGGFNIFYTQKVKFIIQTSAQRPCRQCSIKSPPRVLILYDGVTESYTINLQGPNALW